MPGTLKTNAINLKPMKISKATLTLIAAVAALGSLLWLSLRMNNFMFDRLLVCSLILTGVFAVRALGRVS